MSDRDDDKRLADIFERDAKGYEDGDMVDTNIAYLLDAGQCRRISAFLRASPEGATFTDDQLWNMVRVYHGWKTDDEMIESVGYSMELYVAKMREAVKAACSRTPQKDS